MADRLFLDILSKDGSVLRINQVEDKNVRKTTLHHHVFQHKTPSVSSQNNSYARTLSKSAKSITKKQSDFEARKEENKRNN